MDNAIKETILGAIDGVVPELADLSRQLYERPEIGGEEVFASEMLRRFLSGQGFEVEANYWNTEHAFKAVYDSGKPGPAIGIFAEYDALPGIGHGCGHNLICTSSMAAAAGLRTVLDQLGGRLIVFGTPGEENIQTKSLMAPEGAFDEADVAMMVHPTPNMTSVCNKTLAIESLQIEFFGKSSHAGAAPEEGINALDAAVLCYHMIQLEKQYYPNTNVYGIINDGGEKASTIPAYASMKFLTRAWDMPTLARLRTMVEGCAEAAARATGCTCHIFNNETTNAALLSSEKLSEVFCRHLGELGEEGIQNVDMKASTDMGDVSQRIPSIHPWLSLRCQDAVLHSVEFADATVSDYAKEYLRKAAGALALTGAEVLQDEDLFAAVKAEFLKKTAEKPL